jgi:glycosyltransferase involved in cell wall biosynthesis
VNRTSTRVSVGLPVYNGEDYVVHAIESILNQTFVHFEFIISDNCSTDRTEAICRAFAHRDPRIRYHRQARNLGATANENFLVGEARGEYFIWINHDDIYAPTLIESAVKILDNRAAVVVAYGRMITINSAGEQLQPVEIGAGLSSTAPHRRFARCVLRENCVHAALGVFRTSALRKTLMNQPYYGSDHPMMAEVALMGELYEIPEYLFYRRVHPKSSLKVNKGHRSLSLWFDPSRKGRGENPFWLRYKQFIRSVLRHREAGLWEQVQCLIILQRWPLLQFRNWAGKKKRRLMQRFHVGIIKGPMF